ncbi:O-antigen ligase family protein [Granulicella tundricola]|uniref:O-antigen polymerase family protein n=1 Tax=Granulicella tundricola (strain ATCC BAA-1859 / DSM 23138 / MP5ACTX9) TaxID=1198114 RepID=E8X022_GRATM|nr:O-antigen ligase family protein [Granulicella tundricola]ADW68918.1 O-antigen polymerase family protein [Granulicella tundricola MP5ACTX9]
MSIIILIPTAICLYAILRGSVQKAFLNVFIPIFMLFPIYFYWKVAFLPPIDVAEAVLLPIGIAMLATQMKSWRFTSMDVWLGFFIFSSAYSDYLHGKTTAGIFEFFSNICIALVPYMAGKLLIEQYGARVATVRRFVICLFAACLIAGYEYRMGANPFSLMWARFFPDELFAWKTQFRWGWGRVSGPYGQSELAGIVFFFGLVLTLWLGYNHLWERKFSRANWLPFNKGNIIAWFIAFTLLMTQARGPWLGALVAVPIALIGRAKNLRRAAILVAVIGLGFGSIVYTGLKSYANQPTTSDEQQTAQYRQQLLDNYVPTAKAGGAWGWGQDFPRAMGQDSVDNEYLFVALTQGWVGLLSLCLLSAETIVRLVIAIIRCKNKEDCYFALSLLGIFAGMLLTLFTVFLGNQPYEIFFLLCGWSQSLVMRKAEALPEVEIVDDQPRQRFRQIYT